MDKKIGLFWLRDDFRFAKNDGLIEATTNHDLVVVFFLYKQNIYKDQEAQKWWLSRSLINFREKLSKLNINLEIVEVNSFKFFFDELIKITKTGIERLGSSVINLAKHENLFGQANSVKMRLKK